MSNDLAARIGKNVASVRKLKKRTQAEIAEVVGIDTVSLSRIERGVTMPSLATLDNIANGCGVPLSSLMNGVSSKSITLADNIANQLEPLSETDRLFLLQQVEVWANKLGGNRKKK